jgi:hypothetical protein
LKNLSEDANYSEFLHIKFVTQHSILIGGQSHAWEPIRVEEGGFYTLTQEAKELKRRGLTKAIECSKQGMKNIIYH